MTAPYSFKNEIPDAKSPLIQMVNSRDEILDDSVHRIPLQHMQIKPQLSVDTMSGIGINNVFLNQQQQATPTSPEKSSFGRRVKKTVSFSNLNNLIDERERSPAQSARKRKKSVSPKSKMQ